MEYFLISIFITMLIFLNIIMKNKIVKSASFIVVCVVMVWFAGFKKNVGFDSIWYELFFIHTEGLYDVLSGKNNNFKSTNFEIGYKVLNAAIKSITKDPQYIFAISALVMTTFYFFAIKKYTHYYLVATLLLFNVLFVNLFMEGIRQGIAIFIFFYSIKFIHNNKLLLYGLWIAVAMTFHLSAIILFPVYFILNKKIPKFLVVITLALGAIFMVVGIGFGVVGLGLLDNTLGYIDSQAKTYLGSQNFGEDYGLGFGFYERFLFLAMGLIFYRKITDDPYFRIFFNLYFLSFIVYSFFSDFTIIPLRIGLYFKISSIICYSKAIDLTENQKLKYLIILGIVAYSFFNLYIFYNNNKGIWIPYDNYFYK